MAASIFKAAWWPLHVAVAWALTRDRAFVESSNRAGKSLLSVTIALAMDKVDGKPTERYFKGSTDDAWSALREEMAAGNIRASGTPFRRVADLQGSAVETNEMAREISLDEIASSRLQDDGHDKDCLIPEDWRVAHGSNWNNLWGFRNVRVFRADVLRAFPTAVSKLSDTRHGNEEIEGRHPDEQPQQPPDDQPQQPRVGTRPTRERASRALQALYPNGVPDQVTLSNAKLLRAVGDWLDQKLEDVSDPTILRAAGRRK